jgi:GDPmannose 4,6-dehydratase
MPRALITGISGQDGSYLTELLLGKGYEIHGIVRPATIENPKTELPFLQPVLDRIQLQSAELGSLSGSLRIVGQVRPDECYHLAAESYVGTGFDDLAEMMHANLFTTHNLLEAVLQKAPECRFYYAGTSEMFGDAPYAPQDEKTPFHLARYYRRHYGLPVCCGILYNHESPRRGPQFVTRKVTSFVAGLKNGRQGKLRLGNLKARRDWGHARDYVRAMWLMLQRDRSDDYVIATGISHSVEELLEAAFSIVGQDYRAYAIQDPVFFREKEKVELVGRAAKAREKLGWEPGISFAEMVREMVEEDIRIQTQRT